MYLNPAVKKGYSGTAVYTKKKPEEAEYKLGLKRFDQEGRIIKIRYPNFTLINVYLPHGGRQKENLDYKLKVYQYLFAFLNKIKDKNIILLVTLSRFTHTIKLQIKIFGFFIRSFFYLSIFLSQKTGLI